MYVKNSKKLSNFNAAINALPTELRKIAKKSIMEKCYLNTNVQFDNRRTGRTTIREYEAIQIINVFAEYGIDAITGNELKTAV